MTAIHDQAMHYIYQQVLERLLSHMSQAQRASLQLLIQRLLVAAGGPEYIGTYRLLVLQGNDQRSARLLAMLRAAQLSIALRAPVTFQLRVLVVSLPVADSATLECHERGFNALFLQDDPRVQLQMIKGREVVPFSRHAPAAPESWLLARDAMLMFGHLVDASPEALLGSRLHLELAAAVGFALQAHTPADVLITAIPACQRRRYLAWARRSLRLAGERGSYAVHQCLATLAQGLSRLHGGIGGPSSALAEPAVGAAPQNTPVRLIAIDDLLPPLLEEQQLDLMLGCRFEGPGRPAIGRVRRAVGPGAVAGTARAQSRTAGKSPGIAAGWPAGRQQAARCASTAVRQGIRHQPDPTGVPVVQPVCQAGEEPGAFSAVLACRHAGGAAIPASGLAG